MRAKPDEPEKFHNPYHFVPVKSVNEGGEGGDFRWKQLSNRDDTAKGKIRKEMLNELLQKEHGAHDRYFQGEDIYHGRITCKLTTKTPIFIGAWRDEGTENRPGRAVHFELGSKPAIPASSLRGLISSVAEAASNSALRVLENRSLSRRADIRRESLGAIGMLVKNKDGKGMGLLPLTMPPSRNNQPNKKWREVFKKYPGLVVYLDGYEPDSDKTIQYVKGSFLEKNKPASWSSANNKEYWYCRLDHSGWNSTAHKLDVARPQKKGDYLLGQKPADKQLHKKSKDGYTRGILRILGIEGRKSDIPITYKNRRIVGKKHEIFIPFPEDESKRNEILDATKAFEHFHKLADERADKEGKFPFHLKGMKRTRVEEKSTLRLRENDLVYFDVEKKEKGYVVSRLSVSAVWRCDVGGSVHDYFSDIDKELLPFNPDRKKVSPAELLFGFTEDWKGRKKDKNDVAALAYRGRVRFSHALLEDKDEEDPYLEKKVILKILDKPKPPCPAMYFTKIGQPDAYIAKHALKRNNEYAPKGRKFYLHHREELDEEGRKLDPWETHPDLKKSRLKQKVEIRPVKKERTFLFHVDFENLNKWELGLLCYSLQPAENFLHKIGMGKPIGLGSVDIQVEKIEYINRLKRYSEDDLFNSDRRYHTENEPNFETLRNAFKTWAQKEIPDIIHALELLGNRDAVKYRVHTPLTIDQKNAGEENETFKWFVNNEKKDRDQGGKQQLKSITPQDSEIPTLSRNRS